MATKKAASTAKKSGSKKPTSSKKQTTNVTTVKAVESAPVREAAAKTSVNKRRTLKFGLNRTPVLGAAAAEFIGTFILAAAIISGQGNQLVVLFGMLAVVLAVGTVSGGYVNPALVIGAWVTRRMPGARALAYLVAQVLGAMLALVVLNVFVSNDTGSSSSLYGATTELFKAAPIPEGKEWYIFLSEFIGTLIFGFAVAGATRERKERTAAALTVAGGLFVALMIAGSAASAMGGSAILNPAVAVSLQAIDFKTVWPVMVYAVGAALGAVIGFVLYDLVRSSNEEDKAQTA